MTKANRTATQAIEVIKQLQSALVRADLDEEGIMPVITEYTLLTGKQVSLTDDEEDELFNLMCKRKGVSPTGAQPTAVGSVAHQALRGRPLDHQQAIRQRLADFHRKGGGLPSPFTGMTGGAPSGPGPSS